MGYYVEVPDGPFNKAEKIIKIFGARKVSQEQAEAFVTDGEKAVICVVRNPNFEAAAFCHSLREFKQFTHREDTREKTWLVVDDRAVIEKVTGYVAESTANVQT
jgi:hypothetical protein